MSLKYKRILLKLSGESLAGTQMFGYDHEALTQICEDIKSVIGMGAEICVVVGGGNICRGSTISKMGIERVSADYMGMLATVMNALALQSMLESHDISTRVQSAVPMTTVCEPYIRRKAIRHMEKGRVVIFAAGTGLPYVTTDTNSSLRAIEMKCDALIKATQVDGIYTSDPKIDKNAKRYDKVSYDDVLIKGLKVMDAAAISLAKENNLPIIVYSIAEKGGLCEIVQGKGKCTIVE